MTNVAISGLPAAASLTGTELVPVVQGGVTSRSTAALIAGLTPSLDMIDARNFAGLDPTGSTDSSVAINNALVAGVASHRPVYLPHGYFRLDSPIGTTVNAYDSFSLIGAGGFGVPLTGYANFGAKTVLLPSYTDKPAISLNVVRSVVLKDFAILGLNNAPSSLAYPVDTQSSYITSGCRSNRYSPYCGIAIDALINGGLAAGDRYPGMTYTTSTSGSSGKRWLG